MERTVIHQCLHSRPNGLPHLRITQRSTTINSAVSLQTQRESPHKRTATQKETVETAREEKTLMVHETACSKLFSEQATLQRADLFINEHLYAPLANTNFVDLLSTSTKFACLSNRGQRERWVRRSGRRRSGKVGRSERQQGQPVCLLRRAVLC